MRKHLSILLIASLLLVGMTTVLAASSDSSGGVTLGKQHNYIVAETTGNEILDFVEGFNETQPCCAGSTYAADWFALEYTPSVSYNFARAEFMAGGSTGTFIIQLRNASGGQPGSTIYAQGSFTQQATLGWQGADVSPAYPVVAGTTYWVVFKPIVGDQTSIASSGTNINHAWDYGGDGWDGVGVMFPWMAKFYSGAGGTWPTAYNDLFDGLSDLELTRQYRDQILSATSSGRLYTELLYKASDEALEVLVENPELMARAKQFFATNSDSIAAVVAGKDGASLNTAEVTAFLDAFAKEAPPSLAILAKMVKRDLQAHQGGSLFGFSLK